MSRKRALTLAAVSDLVLAVVFAVAGQATGQPVFGFVAIALLLGAVAVIVLSRRD